MYKIIVTGHGNFGSGLYSSLKLIFGVNESIDYLDFTEGMSYNDFFDKLSLKIDEMQSSNEDVLILTDVRGGSPFRAGAEISLKKPNIYVVSGTNVPMLIEFASEMDFELNVKDILNNAKESISNFELDIKKNIEEDDGI